MNDTRLIVRTSNDKVELRVRVGDEIGTSDTQHQIYDIELFHSLEIRIGYCPCDETPTLVIDTNILNAGKLKELYPTLWEYAIVYLMYSNCMISGGKPSGRLISNHIEMLSTIVGDEHVMMYKSILSDISKAKSRPSYVKIRKKFSVKLHRRLMRLHYEINRQGVY